MFGRLKKKLTSEEQKETEQSKTPSKKTKKPRKTAEAEEDTSPKTPESHAGLKITKKPFIGIREYSSVSEIAESIEKELSETKSSLGEYLRQLDDRRTVAEKSQRLYNAVAKVANTKPSKDVPNKVDVNGLEIVLDATALNELSAIENVVKSHQQRLIALQQAREALQTLDKAGDTEGIKYLALEKEGIPEQILLKLQ